MPKVTEVKKLVEIIQRSGLVDDDQLRQALTDCKVENGGRMPDDPEMVAKFMLERELLTNWHIDKLLDGRYKGFRLGKYRLLDHIGTGGMSAVYLAQHTLMHQRRAVKVLPKRRVNDSSYKERFYLEAQATASLDHPNIVRAYDIDSEGDTHYIVMEYVQGRDVLQIVHDDGPLDFDTAADYTAQSAEGLQHAHEAGLIHRDVKPANLLIDGGGVVKILDLGLALYTDEDAFSLTEAYNENVLGTADYLAPEQAVDSHNVEKTVDVYGLGCSLYFMLVGHPPFPDGTLAQRILKHQSEMPPNIREFRPDCPKELVRVCFKMLQKDPADRYQSMEEIAETMQSWLIGRGKSVKIAGRDSSLQLAGAAHETGAGAAVAPAARPPVRRSGGGSDSGNHLEESKPQPTPLVREETVSNQAGDTDKGIDININKASAPTAPAPNVATSEVAPIVDPVVEPVDEPEPTVGDIGIGVFTEGAAANDSGSSLLQQRRDRSSKGSASSIPVWVWGILGGIALLVIAIVIMMGMGDDGPAPAPKRSRFRPSTVHVDYDKATVEQELS